jgi:hypothetical protein
MFVNPPVLTITKLTKTVTDTAIPLNLLLLGYSGAVLAKSANIGAKYQNTFFLKYVAFGVSGNSFRLDLPNSEQNIYKKIFNTIL